METKERVGVDAGNAFIKFMNADTPSLIRSAVYTPVNPRERYESSPRTRKIEYITGPAKELKGVTWYVGEWAILAGGTKTYEIEKNIQQAKLTLAVLPPGKIKTLALCLASNDYLELGEQLSAELVGVHKYKVDGLLQETEVLQLEVLQEGQHAFRALRTKFRYPELVNGIIDVGGGNSGGVLFKNGIPMLETRVAFEGTVAIGRKLQPFPFFDHVEDKGVSADIDRIMEAIGLRTFVYGNTNKSFLNEFNQVAYGTNGTGGWVKSFHEKMRTVWATYLNSKYFSEIAIVGGGAWILEPLTDAKNRIWISPNSQYITLLGMGVNP